ncbi:metal-dependent hydrolase [Legionella fairfieldensis]|uniref:metal-dependent hydrolase n=1 Tax=Legionella fairfieldensis TaxID=45064 RepID=UPI00048E87EA|nr:metal-dependent hydrolase [Legionella fairfieldensis]
MDPITHAALGAACAQIVLYKQDQSNAWLVGALAALAPDLDIFIRDNSNPLATLLYHRHFTHSLSFILPGGLLVGLFLLLFKRFRHTWKITLLAAMIGYATHGLLDACTNYGTLLLWPFSDRRISWDIIAIINPFFTVPLVLGVSWTFFHKEPRGAIIGLLLAGLFLIFNTVQHHRAVSTAQAYNKKQHWPITSLRAFPMSYSSTHWRVAAKDNHLLRIMTINTPLTQKSKVTPIAIFPLFTSAELPSYVTQSPQLSYNFSLFNWFTDGYLILVKQNPLTLADGRFLTGFQPVIALWGLQFLPVQPYINILSFITLEEINDCSIACHR